MIHIKPSVISEPGKISVIVHLPEPSDETKRWLFRCMVHEDWRYMPLLVWGCARDRANKFAGSNLSAGQRISWLTRNGWLESDAPSAGVIRLTAFGREGLAHLWSRTSRKPLTVSR